jgi:AAA domain
VRAIEAAGGIATTAPQGGDNFHLVDVTPLHGANVKAIVDKDQTGDKWGRKVRDALKGKAASLEFLQAKTGKDAADHIAAGHSLGEFQPYLPPDAGQHDQEDQDVRSLLPRIDWHALWADEEEEFISYPLIPRRRLIAIYSSPKVGKSLLMLELAAAVSCGRTVLGHTPSKRYRVLYVDFENDPAATSVLASKTWNTNPTTSTISTICPFRRCLRSTPNAAGGNSWPQSRRTVASSLSSTPSPGQSPAKRTATTHGSTSTATQD